MKKIVVLMGALVVAVAAQANILQWQVTTEATSGFENVALAQLYGDGVAMIGAELGGINSTTISGQESFYVELLNYEGVAIARSDTASYSSLVEQGMISGGAMSEGRMATWHPSNYSAVPEPTSALLMMMGVAFLGLKRRKV